MNNKKNYLPLVIQSFSYDESDVITASTGSINLINLNDDDTADDIFSGLGA